MSRSDDVSILCGLATEFANVARLYRRAAESDPGRADAAVLRQRIADGIVAEFAADQLPADGSWLPSAEEMEYRLKAFADAGWAAGVLTEADRLLFDRMRDLLMHGGLSADAIRAVRQARAALEDDVARPDPVKSDHQPG